MACAVVDMAYLTGQRIGDVLALERGDMGKEGILFRPTKIEDSTGASVLIEWTSSLRALAARIRSFPKAHMKNVCHQDGQPYGYEAFKSAWRRALTRCGIKDTHIHDLRAKALTDVDRAHGALAAQRIGAHSTQSQTAGYVRHKKAIQTNATR